MFYLLVGDDEEHDDYWIKRFLKETDLPHQIVQQYVKTSGCCS